MNKIIFAAIVILIAAELSFSKQQNWQFTLVNGDTLSNVSIRDVKGDSVSIVFTNTQDAVWIPVDSIVKVRKIRKSKFWRGAGIGILAGTSVGAVIGRSTYEEPEPSSNGWNFDFGPGWSAMGGGIVGGIAGFITGGLIGLSYGRDEIYLLPQMDHKQKINTMWVLLAR